MELTAIKISGILVGTAVASAGAYGVYHSFSVKSSELVTIKSKLESHFKGTNTIFLTEDHEEWSKLQSRYDSVQNKPKKLDEVTSLTLEEVKTWCTSNVNEGFKSESDVLYKQVKEICFLNVKTLLGELSKDGLKSTNNADHEDWKKSWDSYNGDDHKESKGLKIKDSDKDVDLNGPSTDRNKGGSALHAWCTKTKDRKMYDAGSLLPVFKAWCV